MDYTEEELKELRKRELELIANEIRSQLIPMFSKKKKNEVIQWILKFKNLIEK